MNKRQARILASTLVLSACASQSDSQSTAMRVTRYCASNDGFVFETSAPSCAPAAREVTYADYHSLKELRDRGERVSLTVAPELPLVKTNTVIWGELAERERESVRSRYRVTIAEAGAYATIMDAQVADESTPGTSGGAALGSALGSAKYVDSAFRGPTWNYSATNHLGASLLGGLIGSAMDQPARRAYHVRYLVKTPDGNLQQIDQVKDEPFRQPSGACVSLPDMGIVSPAICDADIGAFRARYLEKPATKP